MARGAAARTQEPASLRLMKGRGNGTDSGGRKVAPPPPFVRLPPDPPDWLSGEIARAEWVRIVPELQRVKLTKPIDAAALASYCEMVDLMARATEAVHGAPLVVENRTTKRNGDEAVWYTTNPAVAVQLKAQAALRAWCAEFGLTPAAEGKVSKDDGAADTDLNDPFG